MCILYVCDICCLCDVIKPPPPMQVVAWTAVT